MLFYASLVAAASVPDVAFGMLYCQLCCVVLRYYAMSVMLFDVVLCGYCAILISVYGCYVRCTHIRKQVKPHASNRYAVR